MVPSTECGDHMMLLHADRVKLKGTHEYRLSKLDRCLTLRADLARAVAHTRQASAVVRHSDFLFFILLFICVRNNQLSNKENKSCLLSFGQTGQRTKYDLY